MGMLNSKPYASVMLHISSVIPAILPTSKYMFCSQESLAFIFEMAHLYEDALREYDELELCYLETGKHVCLCLCCCCLHDLPPCLSKYLKHVILHCFQIIEQ